jgi:agmatinase
MNFLDISPEESKRENAKVVILPVPFENTTSYGGGTINGPEAIIKASSQVEFFDEELEKEPFRCGIHTQEPLDLTGKTGEAAIEAIETAADKIFEEDKFLFALGGEHSITAGLVRAARKKYSDIHVVHLDAHADMRAEYQGTEWSHASVMRRISEMGVPHTSIGIRALSKEEFELIKSDRKNYFFAHEIAKNPDWIKSALKTISGKVFLTVDIDVFDSGFLPDTGTPEPGGLGWYQVTEFIKALTQNHTVIGADLVELAPNPNRHASDFTAAKLVYKIISYRF